MFLRSFFPLRFSLGALALVVAGMGRPVPAQTHASESVDHSRHHAKAAVTDAATGPFATDAPLRAGMGRVRKSVESLTALTALTASSSVGAAGESGVDDTRVLGMTAEIRSAIQSIFAECRLPPDADAALHPLLADLLQASAALTDAPSSLTPVAQMQRVMTRYDAKFRDEDSGHFDGH